MNKSVLAGILFLLFPNLSATSQPIWGRLANPGFDNEPVKSAYFFAGNWKNGVKFYEFDGIPNTDLYTINPSDTRHLGWSESVANREFAVNTLILAGVNVINMSYWGPPGTDNWAYWAPMQTSAYAHNELFDIAVNKNILIAPYIESYAATDSSEGFSFMDCFPGTEQDPAPELIVLIEDLIDRYLINPQNTEWPEKWAQIYDRSGEKRYLISIIHVASNQDGMTHQDFADGFDNVAEKVFDDTGVLIGFAIDALPPTGTYAPGFFKPSAAKTGPELFNQSSILAIQCFIPEIWTGVSDEDSLLSWKYQFSSEWINTGIPFIQDISPGYDSHIVFPGSPVYGNNNDWRDGLSQLINNLERESITFNTWNGYTEGFAGVSTLQYGDATYYWICSLFSGICDDTVTSITTPVTEDRFILYQNFPNPFNKSTIISYDLAEGSYITIKVYDAFGNEIEIIESSFKTAGTYETVWNPCNCPNGLYFIRLESNGSDFIRKALFLKQP
jgi:hypothetical protein